MDESQSDLGTESDGERSNAGTRFVELLGASERSLFGYIFSLTGNWNDSQEVMQRVRIRVWEQFDQYDETRPFEAWARAIAYYLVLAFRKERSRQREYFSEGVLELLKQTYAADHEAISSTRATLINCLERLPQDQREIVVKYYSDGGAAAVADSIGKTANAVRQAVFRIRKTLLNCVDRNRPTSHSL